MKEEQVHKTIARLQDLYEEGHLPLELFETKKRELLAQLSNPFNEENNPDGEENSSSTQEPNSSNPDADPGSEEIPLVNAFVPPPDDLSQIRQLKEGQLIRNRYRLLKLLGSGGMGQVFLAQDIRFEKKYALKALHPWVVSHEPIVNRFVQEFKIMEKLNHQGIVRTFLLDEDPEHDSLFFLMEYVEGETLQAMLDRAIHERGIPPFSGLEAFDYLSKLANILLYTHSKRVIHRDLKPTNIMVFKDGKDTALKLLDFGLAKHLSGGEANALHTGQAGTFFYIAPEQLMGGEAATNAADIFSIGVISYQMLTGSLPVAMATPPSEVNPDLPQQVDLVLRKAMDVHWQRRFQSIDEYLNALQEALRQPTTRTSQSVATHAKPGNERWLSEENMTPPNSFKLQTHAGPPPQSLRSKKSKKKATTSTSQPTLKARAKQRSNTQKTLPSQSTTRKTQGSPTASLTPSHSLSKERPISNADRIARLRSQKKSQPPTPPQKTAPSSTIQSSQHMEATHVIQAHEQTITSLSKSSNGQFLVSSSLDNTIKFWDPHTWSAIHMIEVPPHGLLDFAWSPSSQRLAFLADNNSVEVWDFQKKQQQNLFSVENATRLAWSSREDFLFVCSSDNVIEFWNLNQNRCEKTLRQHKAPIVSMHSPSGGRYLATSDNQNYIWLWDANNASQQFQCTQPGSALSAMTTNHNQSHMVVGTQKGELQLWDLQQKQLVKAWRAHSKAIHAVCFHPNNQWIASGGEDKIINLWSLQDFKKVNQFKTQSHILCFEVSQRGGWLASACSDHSIKIWDTSDWK